MIIICSFGRPFTFGSKLIKVTIFRGLVLIYRQSSLK